MQERLGKMKNCMFCDKPSLKEEKNYNYKGYQLEGVSVFVCENCGEEIFPPGAAALATQIEKKLLGILKDNKK